MAKNSSVNRIYMVVAAQRGSSLLAELELCVRARSPLPWLQPRARRAPYCDRAPGCRLSRGCCAASDLSVGRRAINAAGLQAGDVQAGKGQAGPKESARTRTCTRTKSSLTCVTLHLCQDEVTESAAQGLQLVLFFNGRYRSGLVCRHHLLPCLRYMLAQS